MTDRTTQVIELLDQLALLIAALQVAGVKATSKRDELGRVVGWEIEKE